MTTLTTTTISDICQRKRPNGELCCGHLRKNHKPDKMHLRTKTNASSGGYTEIFVNLAPTHCQEFCSCTAFIEKDGSGEEKILPVSARAKEVNPFLVKEEKHDEPDIEIVEPIADPPIPNSIKGDSSKQQPVRKGSKTSTRARPGRVKKIPEDVGQGGLF